MNGFGVEIENLTGYSSAVSILRQLAADPVSMKNVAFRLLILYLRMSLLRSIALLEQN